MHEGRPAVTTIWPALWGLGGVMLLLGSAVVRLGQTAFEGLSRELSALQWVALILLVVVMAWAEGYRGFQRGFAPRVVARARYLAERPVRVRALGQPLRGLRLRALGQPLRGLRLDLLFAPLFCMGFFHATRRRRVSAFALTAGVVGLVLLVRLLPQPWRGIVDAGVVVGLGWGLAALAVLAYRAFVLGKPDTCALDLPEP